MTNDVLNTAMMMTITMQPASNMFQ